ncbi:MAG: hypothetical protein ACP5VS_14220 [Desulfomonilaceae bacterium]
MAWFPFFIADYGYSSYNYDDGYDNVRGSDGLDWNFTKTGSFLEGYFEYDVPVFKDMWLGLWARGTWMRFAGSGSRDTRALSASNYNFNYGFVSNYNYGNFSGGSSYSGSYNFYDQTSSNLIGTLNIRNLGGGVTASLFF